MEYLSNDANQRIAPWFGRMTIEQQRLGMIMDFKQKLSSLDTLLGDDESNVFSKSFVDMFHGDITEGYRNKNKFTFGYDSSAISTDNTIDDNSDLDLSIHLKLGFIEGHYPMTYIVDCDNACTINDNFKNICRTVEKIVKKSNIKPFLPPPRIKKNKRNNSILIQKKHEGVWKYLTIRHSVTENKYMVILSNFTRHIHSDIKSKYLSTIDEIRNALFDLEYVKSFNLNEFQNSLEPQSDDVIQLIFEKSTDLSLVQIDAEFITNIKNKESVLYEQLLGYVFSISPNSFFQINTEATIVLYTKIREMCKYMIELNNTFDSIKTTRKKVLIDLYCGTGTIGICVSDLFDHIIGVDEVASAIENANLNIELNSHKNKSVNFSFITGRCENSLMEIEKLYKDDDQLPEIYLVVDPSREGLHKRVRQFIKDIDCVGFVYCSCNVQTWMSDVKELTSNVGNDKSYTPLQTLIVDLFPYTQHYEVLSCFKKH